MRDPRLVDTMTTIHTFAAPSMQCSTTDNALTVEIPDDWEIWEGADDDLLVAAAPEEDDDGIQPQLLVTHEQLETDTDAQNIMVGNVVYSQTHLPAYQDHGSGTFGCDGYEVAWSHYTSDAGGLTLTAISYFVVRGRDAYLLNFKANPEMFPRWHGSFEQIVRSIQFAQRAHNNECPLRAFGHTFAIASSLVSLEN